MDTVSIVILLIWAFLIGVHIGMWTADVTRQRDEVRRALDTMVTCEHCIHLCENNDGSVYCDSVFKNGCLPDITRPFKEVKTEKNE